MTDLTHLAQLIQTRNAVHREIAALIGRPAHAGHVGEYIAAAVFGIALEASAAHKGSDGVFAAGPLAGRFGSCRSAKSLGRRPNLSRGIIRMCM